jgi:hypothetical protein
MIPSSLFYGPPIYDKRGVETHIQCVCDLKNWSVGVMEYWSIAENR